MANVLRAQERTQQNIDAMTRGIDDFKRDSNRRWGELANKLGTMAEDLVAPSVPRIFSEIARCDGLLTSAVRVRCELPGGRNREFDVVAQCGDRVLIVETRSRLRPDDVEAFVQAMAEARDYLPEHAGRKLIGALATLYPDPSLVRAAERAGLLVLGLGPDLMEVKSAPGFVPREF